MKKPRIRIIWYPNIYTLELISPKPWHETCPAILAYGFKNPPNGFVYMKFGKHFCNALRFVRLD